MGRDRKGSLEDFMVARATEHTLARYGGPMRPPTRQKPHNASYVCLEGICYHSGIIGRADKPIEAQKVSRGITTSKKHNVIRPLLRANGQLKSSHQ